MVCYKGVVIWAYCYVFVRNLLAASKTSPEFVVSQYEYQCVVPELLGYIYDESRGLY